MRLSSQGRLQCPPWLSTGLGRQLTLILGSDVKYSSPAGFFQTGFDTQTALDSETSNCRRLKRNEEKWVKWRWAVHVSPSVLTDNTCSTSFSFWISIKFNLPHFSLTPVTDDFRAVVHARTFIDVSERTDRSSKTERKQDSVCVSNFKLRTSNGCPSLLCM